MSFALGMLAVTATCIPVDKPTQTKLETVTAFFAALNSANQVAMGTFITPGARYQIAPGDTLDLAELLSMLPPTARLEVVNMRLDANGDVEVDTHASDGAKGSATVKVEGGCITSMVNKL